MLSLSAFSKQDMPKLHFQLSWSPKYKYEVTEELEYYALIRSGLKSGFIWSNGYVRIEIISDRCVKLTLFEGYAWDGASGAIDTDTWMLASLIHDALYQLMRERVISRRCRGDADKEMYGICVAEGMFIFRAWYSYHGVRQFGAKYTK